MTDYARLRALAEAAGPFVRYELDDPNPNFIVGSDPGDDSSQIVIGDVYDDRVADYIAAIDPPTLIALLDRLDELESREPEWEYVPSSGLFRPSTDRFQFDCAPSDLVRRRKAGEWEPVTGDDDED